LSYQPNGCRLAAAELARGFDDDVSAESGPVDQRGVSLRQHRDLAAANRQRLIRVCHLRAEPPVSEVELEQVRQGPRVGDVIDRHDLEVSAVSSGRTSRETGR